MDAEIRKAYERSKPTCGHADCLAEFEKKWENSIQFLDSLTQLMQKYELAPEFYARMFAMMAARLDPEYIKLVEMGNLPGTQNVN